MSFHKKPKYQIPELIQALKDHGLEHDTPSQLADAFRTGYLAAQPKDPAPGPVAVGDVTDEEADALANLCYTSLLATGYNGGMGGLTWDRALVRMAALRNATPPGGAGGEVGETGSLQIKPLAWSDERQPCLECRYNHVVADSALGRFSIEWRGWKELDSRTIYVDGEHVGDAQTLDDAKLAAAQHLSGIVTALIATPASEQATEADQLLTALDPDTYRTDGGFLNIPKIKAAMPELPKGMEWATLPGASEPCRHGHRMCLVCMNGPLARRFPVPIESPTVEAVEKEVGMGAAAWDCVDPAEIISAVLRLAAKEKA